MFEEMKEKVKVSEHAYRYIGQHANRAEADELVSGKRLFLDDLFMPGMLTVRVLRSPYPNCIIRSIDTEKAKQVPGVLAVCTYKDAPDWKCGLPSHRRVLDSHMRFTGDSVALVAAETLEAADEALEKIEVDYEVLPFVLDCEEALKEDAPQLYPEYPGNEIMKVPLDGVQVVDPDTHGTRYDAGMIGSRGTITMGTTAVNAAKDARRKLLEMAALKLNANVEDLDTEDFLVFNKNMPQMRLPWIAVTGSPEMTINGTYSYKQNFDKPNFALYLAEVCVKLETGEAKLIRAIEGTDVGQIVDPINIRMQAEGSFGSAGGDTGLFEEMIMDRKLGRFMNGNMIDYKWRTFNNFPQFDTVILESEWDSEAFHAIGFGEITPSPAPAAILMAVSNAIGVEMTEYPCTPTKILKAMGKIQ